MALSLVSLAPAASLRNMAAEGGAAAKAAGRYGQLPLSFEENRGQTDKAVRYLSRGTGYTLFLTEKDAVLSLTSIDANQKSTATAIRLGFAGSRGAAGMHASDMQPGVSNYISGSDSSNWLRGLKHYGRVNYQSVYPGIDAVFYGNQRLLEYDFVVKPNADAKQIRLTFDGVKGVRVNDAGELVLRTELGDLVQGRPVAYQMIDGAKKLVDARYAMRGKEVAFALAKYDRTKPLVIDPTLQWSTFLGGSGLDFANGIAVDAANNVYVVGYTSASNFPANLRFGGSIGGTADAYLVKYSPDGKTILYSTFLSGDGNDQANGVAVSANGTVTVVGFTDSSNYPTVNNRQFSYGGNGDAFVTTINAAGNQLVYSSYIGGIAQDTANDVVLDSNGGAVFVGSSLSANFAPNAPANGGSDAFVVRMLPDGSDYVYRILIGSRDADAAYGVAIDATDNVYVAGRTNSVFFQGTPGVVQFGLANGDRAAYDGWVAKLNPTGGTIWRTLLGGAGNDEAVSVAVDVNNFVYVFGNTDSNNYPVTGGSFRGAYSGNGDTFVTMLTPDATQRSYSTYLGGTGTDLADRIVINRGNGVAYLLGTTSSADFPVSGPIQGTLAGGTDLFLTEMAPNGGSLITSTFFGGASNEIAGGLAMDAGGNLYVSGTTNSSNYPVTAGTQQPLMSGTQDAFVTRFSNCPVVLTPILSGTTPGRAHNAVAETGTITVAAAAECSWTAQSSDSWVAINTGSTGAGNGTVTYTVAGNTFAPRSATITIGNQRFTINQAGGGIVGNGCVYPLQIQGGAAADIVDAPGVTRTILIGTSTPNCAWTLTSDRSWLLVGPATGSGSTTTSYIVQPNFTSQLRAGVITLRDLTNNQTSTITVTQLQPGLTQRQRLVTQLYFNLLGRYPSANEILFQEAQLNAGVLPADLIVSFMNSDEFNANARFVAGLYRGILGRDAEYGGWLYQRGALLSGQVTQTSLVNNFLNSQEFQLKYGTLTNEAFVNLMYSQVLGRFPTLAELQFQSAALQSGNITRLAMATAFLNTPEFRIGTANRTTAFLLYAGILGRGTSTEEINFRTTQLTITPLRNIVFDFTQTPEFVGITQ